MLASGVIPASVTPLRPDGTPDTEGLARLAAFFRAAGCAAIVLAGTNGEGPSLSAIQKRDLVRQTVGLAEPLPVILTVATSSLSEAGWLLNQAAAAGAAAALLMPPFYFRSVTAEGIAAWFEDLLARARLPVLIYNFPQMTGATLAPDLVHRLARFETFAGLKDSSGEPSNLEAYRQACGADRRLYVGDETLLLRALAAGWSGTISGAANLLALWLSQIAREWTDGRESASAKFDLVRPVIEELRRGPQPALNKAVMHRLGLLASPAPLLPLMPAPDERVGHVLAMLRETVGLRPGALGLSQPLREA